MTKRDRFPAFFFLFFAFYICIESLHLGIGHWRKPGPGFFSFWSAAALGFLALIVLIHTWKSKENREESPEQASWRGRIFCFLSLLVFILLLDTLGFILTSIFFVISYLKVVERKGWMNATLTALAISLASYALFQICLQSQLPKGVLETLGI